MMTRLTAVLIAIYGFLFSTSTYSSPAENKSEPIRIITNNWTSQIVLSHVTGQLFQKMGYQLEYISLPIADQWGALAHGLAHAKSKYGKALCRKFLTEWSTKAIF